LTQKFSGSISPIEKTLFKKKSVLKLSCCSIYFLKVYIVIVKKEEKRAKKMEGYPSGKCECLWGGSKIKYLNLSERLEELRLNLLSRGTLRTGKSIGRYPCCVFC
jgi:hypothetical protein